MTVTTEVTGGRRDRLRERLADADLDALVLTNLTNVRWLTGFTGSNATLVVARDPATDLIVTDGRYTTQIAAQVPDLPAKILREGLWKEVVAQIDTGPLGFEADHLDWQTAERLRTLGSEEGVEVVAAPGHVEHLRQVKDEHEIAALAEACAITVAAFEDALGWVAAGMTERDVAVRLERRMVDLGAEGPAFETIVAAGENSAVPHHRPTDREIRRGDLVKIDFGARHLGYHADMTRTFAVGDPGDEMRAIHDLVLRSQAAGREAARAGAGLADVDRACREVIEEAGHGEAFLHSTGHGVGLEIHERPTVAKTSDGSLEEAMTITVEPGVYLAGRGGVRIEDTVVVRSGDPDVLTPSPRELLVL